VFSRGGKREVRFLSEEAAIGCFLLEEEMQGGRGEDQFPVQTKGKKGGPLSNDYSGGTRKKRKGIALIIGKEKKKMIRSEKGVGVPREGNFSAAENVETGWGFFGPREANCGEGKKEKGVI